MRITQLLFGLTLSFFLATGNGAKVTITNNCPTTIWPATLTGSPRPQLSTTGFELPPKATSAPIDLPSPWSGRFWARTRCATDASGRFSCATGDCGSGQVACNGNGGAPPATLVEITAAAGGGQDFYDVSNVDGFNLPISFAPRGGSGDCTPSSCPANINAVCPDELAVKAAPSGEVVGCKSACTAFNRPEFCCTGEYSLPDRCPPTEYSRLFKNQCPQAYSYAYDDRSSTFTCFGGPDYTITFCPSQARTNSSLRGSVSSEQ